jgi:hypothetical protein
MRQSQSFAVVSVLLAVISLAVLNGENSEAEDAAVVRPAQVYEDGSVGMDPAVAGIFRSTAAFRRGEDGTVEVRCVGSEEELTRFASGAIAEENLEYPAR